jgi:aspartyl-tRNA(Asn)/glutamyl-tRNA(Gln) amidotransferase subunit C
MSLERKEIKNIAALAHLALDDAGADALAKDFEEALALMSEVGKLTLDAVPETARVTDEENVWREDVVTESLSPEDALRNGTSSDGYFEVPGILDWDK